MTWRGLTVAPPIPRFAPPWAEIHRRLRLLPDLMSAQRPKKTPEEAGSNFIWLTPANSRADQVFAIRNMLANTSFAQSVAHVPAPKEGSVGPALTQSVMGDYYPTASRYNIKVVEKVGPITCRGKSLVTAQN